MHNNRHIVFKADPESEAYMYIWWIVFPTVLCDKFTRSPVVVTSLACVAGNAGYYVVCKANL